MAPISASPEAASVTTPLITFVADCAQAAFAKSTIIMPRRILFIFCFLIC